MQNLLALFAGLSELESDQITGSPKPFEPRRPGGDSSITPKHMELLRLFSGLCLANQNFKEFVLLLLRRASIEGEPVTVEALLSIRPEQRLELWKRSAAFLASNQSADISQTVLKMEEWIRKFGSSSQVGLAASQSNSMASGHSVTAKTAASPDATRTSPSTTSEVAHRVPVVLQDPRVEDALRTIELQLAALQASSDVSGEVRRMHSDQIGRITEHLSRIDEQLAGISTVRWLSERVEKVENEFARIASARKSFEDYVDKSTASIKRDRVPLTSVLDWQEKFTKEHTEFQSQLARLVQGNQATYKTLEERLLGLEERIHQAEAEVRRRSSEVEEEARQKFDVLTTVSDARNERASELNAGVDYVPVRVFLADSDDEAIRQVSSALLALAAAFNLEFANQFQSETGSWLGGWLARAVKPFSAERIRKVIERVLHREAVDEGMRADVVVTLLKALEKQSSATIQIGSLIVVKSESGITVRTLTTKQMSMLDQNPRLLKSPTQILEGGPSIADGPRNTVTTDTARLRHGTAQRSAKGGASSPLPNPSE